VSFIISTFALLNKTAPFSGSETGQYLYFTKEIPIEPLIYSILEKRLKIVKSLNKKEGEEKTPSS
jgi:hypothetical protein